MQCCHMQMTMWVIFSQQSMEAGAKWLVSLVWADKKIHNFNRQIYIYIPQQKELLCTSYRKMYRCDIVINDIQITDMGFFFFFFECAWDSNREGYELIGWS